MKRPLVVMVSGTGPPMIDGVGDFTSLLTGALARLRPDWRWAWISRRPRWFAGPIFRRDGVTRIRPCYGWGASGRAAAVATVKALRPDIVHIQEQTHSFYETDAALRIGEAARSIGASLVTTLHEYHVELESVAHTTALVKLSDVVIANDPRNAERCLREAGREVDAIFWSGATVLPVDSTAAVKKRPLTVATFGHLNALKSLAPVAEGLKSLRREFPDLLWRLVGPFEPQNHPPHAALEGLLGGTGVEFTGAIPLEGGRLANLLAESVLMILPFADGASERRTSLHAAWALGIPVITTPPPTAATSIRHGENCLLVSDWAPGSWASAVRQVLTDPALAARLRAGGLELARKFSWQTLAERHVEVYERVLEARS